MALPPPTNFIGSIDFKFPLKWINKDAPVILGSATRTRAGNCVVLYPADLSQTNTNIKLVFDWEPYSTITALYSMWFSGQIYSWNGDGGAGSAVFDPKTGVVNIKHPEYDNDVVKAALVGYRTDFWNGEINLISV